MEATATTMADILSAITTILTSVISWVGSIVTVITSNPLILLFVVIGVGLIAIGVVKRLLRL